MTHTSPVAAAHQTRPGNALYPRPAVADGVLLLLTLIAFYLCWLLAHPFLAAITWALALAILGYPLERRLGRRMGRNAGALCAVIVISLVLFTAGVLLFQRVLAEADRSLTVISGSLTAAELHRAVAQFSFTQRVADWLEQRFDVAEQLRSAAAYLARQVPAALRGSAKVLTQFALMLVMLFYFLRDGARLLEFIGGLLPLSEGERVKIFRRVSDTIHATLYGSLAVKVVQGALGGAMFWILGLPTPAMFGIAMALLAMVPLVGTSLVWGPAAVYLFVTGSWMKGLILALWGALVVSLIDNLLYPILVADQLRIHPLAILVSVFGGLFLFGAAGVVLGPLIAACTLGLLEIWRARSAAGATDPE